MAASTYFDQVQKLYIAYFGRPADPVGLNYWAANIDAAGGNFTAAIAGFSASNESQALYASGTTTQLITSIYTALFNRAPEAAGLQYWVSLIDSGTISGARAAYQILNDAGPGDATSIANKLAAANSFTAQIDTSAEIAGYAGATSANYGRAYLAGVDATPASLANAVANVGLSDTVAIATGTKVSTSVPGGPSSQSFTLTTGADTFVGGAGNDTFVGTLTGAFANTDSIDGGTGTDTLTVTDSGNLNVTTASVTNVETASITAGGSLALATGTWTGLTSLTTQSGSGNTSVTAASSTNVTHTQTGLAADSLVLEGGNNVKATVTGSTTGTVTIGGTTAPTGEVTVSNTSAGDVAMGAIAVTGGTKVTVSQATSNLVNTTAIQGAVTVNGGALTTSVTVNNAAAAAASLTVAGVTTNAVTISDKNASSGSVGIITDVSASNYTTLTINDNALKNLSVTGGSGNITIDNNSTLAAPSRTTTLNLTANGLTGGTLSDANVYTTLNVTTAGANSTLANITISTLTNLNVSGSSTLALTSTAGLTGLNAIAITGKAGLSADLSGTTVHTIDASGTSGNVTVTIDGSKASYTGGSGVDKVTLSSVPTHLINGGNGTSDVLTLSATNASNLSNVGLISGFEQVTFTSAANETINTTVYHDAKVFSTAGGNGLTLNNLVNEQTLQLTGAGTTYNLNGSFTGAVDSLKLELINSSGVGVAFATTGITAAGVETLQITTRDGQAIPSGTFNNTVTLLGNDLLNTTISGNSGLTLTAASTELRTVDASGITLGGFTWTSGALTNAAVAVKGSATGTNVIDLSATTASAVTYTGGSGNDTLTIGAITQAATISFGAGTDTLVLTAAGATAAARAHVTGFSTGDIINVDGAKGAANSSAQIALTLIPDQGLVATLDTYLNLAAAGDGSGTTVLSWFNFDGSTYIVQDSSAANTFGAGDSVVQLAGVINLATASVASGVITLGA